MYVQTYTLALPRQHTDRVRLPSAPYSNSFSGRTSLSLSYVEFSSEFCKESTRIMHHHTFYQAIPVLRTFRRGCEPSAQANLQVSRRLSVWVCLWFPALWKWPPLSLSSPRCPTRTITHFRFSIVRFFPNSARIRKKRNFSEFAPNSARIPRPGGEHAASYATPTTRIRSSRAALPKIFVVIIAKSIAGGCLGGLHV